MARDSEKARPHVLPPTSNARGMDDTVTARKTADEKTRKSHMERTRGGAAESREGDEAKGEVHTTIFLFLDLRPYRPSRGPEGSRSEMRVTVKMKFSRR